jgi:F-type H+-transporting ATPase subunit a
VLCLLLISVAKTYARKPNAPPRGIQAFIEPLIIFVRDDIAKSAIGKQSYKKYLPFLLTIFFFIAFNNLLGLIPIFPGGANLTGNIAVAMVMAAIVFIITTLSGTKYYWKHIFAMPGVPKPVLLILTPIEIIGVILKPFVLMIRLFANITAGHIIILSFFSLIFIFGDLFGPAAGYGVSVASVLFVLFMMTLEILVAFLQAYVFTLLSAMYFGMALEQH